MTSTFQTEDYHRLYDILKVGVCMVSQDADETILFANQAILDFYGCADEAAFLELTGGRFTGMQLNQDVSLAKTAGDQQHFSLHFSYMNARRHIREAEATISRAVLQDRPVYIVQMVTRRMLTEDTAPDRLTGLLAPKAFFQKAMDLSKMNLDRGSFTDFCPTCFNVANFRGFNRNNGTAEGDKALSFIAQTLRRIFPDGLFGHINADTFYAILPRADLTLKIEEACGEVNRFLGGSTSALKAGIVVYDQPAPMSPPQLRYGEDGL